MPSLSDFITQHTQGLVSLTTLELELLRAVFASGSEVSEQPPRLDPRGSAADTDSFWEQPAWIGIYEPDSATEPTRWTRSEQYESWWWAWSDRKEIAKKKKSAMRVVWLGESTARGWGNPLDPVCLLERTLNAVAGKEIFEVVDLACSGLRADHFTKLLLQCLQLAPDLIVLLAGNNSTGSTAENVIQTATTFIEEGVRGYIKLQDEDFASRVYGMAAGLAELGSQVPLLMVPTPPNVGGWKFSNDQPCPWLEGDKSRTWWDLVSQAESALEQGAIEKSSELANSLTEIAGPGISARNHELLGRIAIAQENWAEAYVQLYTALNTVRWCTPVPATAELLVDTLSHTIESSQFLDLRAAFQEASPHGIPGWELFLDYCHFTHTGARLAVASIAQRAVHLVLDQEVDITTVRSHCEAAVPLDTQDEAEAHLRYAAHALIVDLGASCEAHLQKAFELDKNTVGVSATMVRRWLVRLPGWLDPSGTKKHLNKMYFPPFLTHPRAVTFAYLVEKVAKKLGVPAPKDLWAGFTLPQGRAAPVDAVLDFAVNPWNIKRLKYHRSAEPEFTLPIGSAQTEDVIVEMTLRAPVAQRGGTVRIWMNETAEDEIEVSDSWQVVKLKTKLQRGRNLLKVIWPPLDQDGTATRTQIAEDLLAGRPTSFFPEFGDIHSITVRRQADATA